MTASFATSTDTKRTAARPVKPLTNPPPSPSFGELFRTSFEKRIRWWGTTGLGWGIWQLVTGKQNIVFLVFVVPLLAIGLTSLFSVLPALSRMYDQRYSALNRVKKEKQFTVSDDELSKDDLQKKYGYSEGARIYEERGDPELNNE